MPGKGLGEAVLTLSTDASKFNAGLDHAEKKADSFGGKLKGLGGLMGGLAAGGAIGSLSQFAKAAADDEVSVGSLRQAIENSGASWDQYGSAVEDAIKRGQNLAFTDDQTRAGLQTLTESTGSVEEAMKRLPLAMDLARAKHISLEQASKLLGKVSDENIKVFARMGISVDANATAEELLAEVHKRTAGQAEVYGNSTKGSIDKVHDAVSEFTEGIGASLGPVQGLVALMPGVQSGMLVGGGAISGISALLKGTMIPSFIASLAPIGATVIALGPIILVVAAIGLAILALKWAWENNLGDIQGKTKAAIDFLGNAFDGFKLLVLYVFKGIVEGVAGAINNVIGTINFFIGAYNALAEKLGLPLLGKIELLTPNLNAVDQAIAQVARDRVSRLYVDKYERAIAGDSRGVREFATGTPFVQGTGLALVHEGEAIIPAADNAAGRSGGRSRSQSIEIPLYLDGREIARAIGNIMIAEARMSGSGI